MTIIRTSTANFSPLSNTEIREWLRIDPTTDNFTVTMLLGAATEIIESLTSLTIPQSTYQIVATSCDGTIALPISPIISVDSVMIDGVEVTGWTYAANIVTLPATSIEPVTVMVTAGFASEMAVPLAIRHAIAVLVSGGYDNRSAIDDQTMTTVNRLIAGQRRYFA